MQRDRALALWRAGQHGWPRSYPVAQFPNAPLGASLAASVVAAVTDGDAHDVAHAGARVLLGVWAYEELAGGVNWFRRGLGAVVLVLVVAALA